MFLKYVGDNAINPGHYFWVKNKDACLTKCIANEICYAGTMTGPFTQNADHIFKCYLLENDPLPKAVPNSDYISFKKKCPVKKNHITEDYLHDFRKGLESELLEEEDDIIKWTNKIIALLKFSFFNEFDEERNYISNPPVFAQNRTKRQTIVQVDTKGDF